MCWWFLFISWICFPQWRPLHTWFWVRALEPYLQRLRPTAPGLNAIHSWFFSKCSYELADIVAFIFNSSFRSGMVPEHWRRSVVTHVPKVARPTSISEFRPIFSYCNSVSPKSPCWEIILVVRRWLFPALDLTTVCFSADWQHYMCLDLLHAPCH